MSLQTWTERRISLREQPEKLAWVVLLASFSIFCALLVIVPSTIYYFVEHGTRGQSAQLAPILGSIVFKPSSLAETIAVTGPRDDVRAGSIIEAGVDSTQGTLSFVSKRSGTTILGSAQIYSSSSIEVLHIREPIFERSSDPYQVRMALNKGQIRFFNNSGLNRDLLVEIVTPHGMVVMDTAGAYTVRVTDEMTEVSVRSGTAKLNDGDGTTVVIEETYRAWLDQSGLHEADTFAVQNLVANGEFQQQEDGTRAPWEPYSNSQNNVRAGSSQYPNTEGRQVLFFSRQEGENYHTEVGVTQQIRQQVNVYDSLVLQFDVKLLHQRPAGGGEQGSEFPLRVELTYTDIYGKQQRWGHGLYYLNPESDDDPNNDKWSLANSEEIPQGRWYSYTSPNLMAMFDELGTRPDTIDSIRFYASGHKYQSIVSGVDLLVR